MSPEVIVEEAFLDFDFEWTLACRFFSSDLANFLPQASHVKGFSPELVEKLDIGLSISMKNCHLCVF